MKVTDLDYSITNPKINNLDWLCDRVSGKKAFQNVIITDGKEGYGKSTLTAGDAYYVAYTLKRKLRLFFKVEALSNYALSTKDEVLIWDDAALSALTLEAYNKEIIKLIKVLLLARKKRHTYFINIQEIYRLKEPIVSRAIGLNHVYSPDGLSLGYYTYYNEAQMGYLHNQWITRKKKQYKMFYSFKARFPNCLYKIFDEVEYEKLKDKAIQSIKTNDTPKKETKLERWVILVAKKAVEEKKIKELGELWGLAPRTIYDWSEKDITDDDVKVLHSQTDNYNYNAQYITPKSENYLTSKELIIPYSKVVKKQTLESSYGL